MELFGIAFSIPVAFVASMLYCLLLARVVAKFERLVAGSAFSPASYWHRLPPSLPSWFRWVPYVVGVFLAQASMLPI